MDENGGGDVSHQHTPEKQFLEQCSGNPAHFFMTFINY